MLMRKTTQETDYKADWNKMLEIAASKIDQINKNRKIDIGINDDLPEPDIKSKMELMKKDIRTRLLIPEDLMPALPKEIFCLSCEYIKDESWTEVKIIGLKRYLHIKHGYCTKAQYQKSQESQKNEKRIRDLKNASRKAK